MNASDAKHLLKQAPFFSELDIATLDTLLAQAVIRQFQVDESVAWENEETDGVSIIASGWLKGIQTTQSGREQILRTFGPGDTFGLITSLSHARNHIRIVALEDCEIHKIPADALATLIDENHGFSRQLIRYLSQNLSAMIALVEDLSLKSVESRLAKFILSQSENDVYLRKKWETQDLIAAQIGTVPDVLSRILCKFEEEGIITFDRQQIKIVDRAILHQKSQD
jgi:CRP/FNR family transcriptional regulator, dissimilatory nitrate respiration regulator